VELYLHSVVLCGASRQLRASSRSMESFGPSVELQMTGGGNSLRIVSMATQFIGLSSWKQRTLSLSRGRRLHSQAPLHVAVNQLRIVSGGLRMHGAALAWRTRARATWAEDWDLVGLQISSGDDRV
jgi:hypothetical protein